MRADGRKCRVAEVARRSDGAVTYRAVLPRRAELPAEVSLTLTEERGYAGGAGDRRPCEAGLRGGTLYGRRLVP